MVVKHQARINQGDLQESANKCNQLHINMMGLNGLEHIAEKPDFRHVSKNGAAKSAVFQPISAIAKQIQALPDDERAALLAMMKGA